jgi:hypothetical protein
MLANLDLAGRGYTEETGRAFLEQLVQRLESSPGRGARLRGEQSPASISAASRLA